MEFCQILRSLRKEHNLTQEELAQKLNVSPAAIGLYEQGSRTPRNDIMKRMSDFFGVSVDYLLGFAEVKKQIMYEPEIKFDDFDYAMKDETANMTAEQRTSLLNMAKITKNISPSDLEFINQALLYIRNQNNK